MREVYSNCVLALAAEDTVDCTMGFLPRVFPQARGRPPSSAPQHGIMRALSSEWGGDFSQMALSARGWTLQERILPSRTLRFTSSGMVWECNQVFKALNHAENMDLWSLAFRAIRLAISGRKDTPAPAGLGTINDMDENGRDISHRNITNFLTSGSSKAMHFSWYTIAEDYSSRKLTKASDKLSALSGLASLLASSVPGGHDDYLAGIWRQGLAEGLLWHTEEPCVRFSTYIAPSWSWASMAGKISYFRERHQFPFESYVDIEEAICNKSLLDPTGSVSGGHIRLVGDVVPVHLMVLSRSSSGQGSDDSMYSGWNGHFGSAYKDQLVFVYPFHARISRHWEALCDERMPFTTDRKLVGHWGRGGECSAKSASEPQFFCLAIGRMHQHSINTFSDKYRYRHWYILLEVVSPSKQVYKRVGIGYFHRSQRNLFGNATREAVTII